MVDIVEKLASSGHLTPAQVERIGESVSSFLAEVRHDPELLKVAQEKLAIDFGNLGVRAMQGAAGAAGGLAMLGLFNLAQDKILAAKDEVQKAKHYKNMLQENPHLTESGASAKQVQQHYNTLYKFNPEYAKDPNVAGAYVRQQMSMVEPNLSTLNNLVSARKQHMDAEKARRDTPARNLARSMGQSAFEHALGGIEGK